MRSVLRALLTFTLLTVAVVVTVLLATTLLLIALLWRSYHVARRQRP